MKKKLEAIKAKVSNLWQEHCVGHPVRTGVIAGATALAIETPFIIRSYKRHHSK